MSDALEIAARPARDLPVAAASRLDDVRVRLLDGLADATTPVDDFECATLVSRQSLAVIRERGQLDEQLRKAFGDGLHVAQILVGVCHMYENRVRNLEERNASLAQSLADTLGSLDGRLTAFATTLREFERNLELEGEF